MMMKSCFFSRAKFFKSNNGHTRLSVDGMNCLTYFEDTEKIEEDAECIQGEPSKCLSNADRSSDELKLLQELKTSQERELRELQELLHMNYEEEFQRKTELYEKIHFLANEARAVSTSDIATCTDKVEMKNKGIATSDDSLPQSDSVENNEDAMKLISENCAMRIEDLSTTYIDQMFVLKESFQSKQSYLEKDLCSLNNTMKLMEKTTR